jgi:hypothetical protein
MNATIDDANGTSGMMSWRIVNHFLPNNPLCEAYMDGQVFGGPISSGAVTGMTWEFALGAGMELIGSANLLTDSMRGTLTDTISFTPQSGEFTLTRSF